MKNENDTELNKQLSLDNILTSDLLAKCLLPNFQMLFKPCRRKRKSKSQKAGKRCALRKRKEKCGAAAPHFQIANYVFDRNRKYILH